MSKKELVILIHGLHQRGFIMRPLSKRLQKFGYKTRSFDYRSLADSIDMHSQRLNSWLTTNHNENTPFHLVGHSLGGLVIRHFIHHYPKWQIGNCVTLGTPHLGSVSAKYVKKIASPLVGNAYQGALDGKTIPLKEGTSLGVIAGSSPKGLGQLFLNHHSRKAKLSRLDSKHDGTVYLSETQLPNASDHIVLPVSHTGMLLNKEVARQTAYFLEHARFDQTHLKSEN